MSMAILKDTLRVYRESDIRVFTRAGLVTSISLILIFGAIQFIKINIGGYESEDRSVFIIINLILALLSALFTSSAFWIIGKKYGPKLGNLLVTNNILKVALTKGDSHYFEKLGESERKVGPNLVINKFINLLLTWLAVTAFLIGFFVPFIGSILSGSGESSEFYIIKFLNAKIDEFGYYLFKIIFVLIISPILLLIVIPIPWMLIDTQLKSYSTGLRINHMVGRLVQQRVASLFAIGGIVSLILVNSSIEFYFALLGFILFFIGFPVALVSFLYNLLFQLEYYDEFIKIIPVPLGITSVAMESKQDDEYPESSLNKDEIIEKEELNDDINNAADLDLKETDEESSPETPDNKES